MNVIYRILGKQIIRESHPILSPTFMLLIIDETLEALLTRQNYSISPVITELDTFRAQTGGDSFTTKHYLRYF